MRFIGNGSRGRLVRGPTQAESDINIVATTVQEAGGGEQSVEVINDRIVTLTAPTYVRHDVQITGPSVPYTVESLDEEVAVATGSRLNATSNGRVRFNVRTGRVNKRGSAIVRRQATPETQTLLAYAAGSLARHCSEAVDARIAGGKTLDVHGAIFSVKEPETIAYARNPHLWASDLNLRFVSVYSHVPEDPDSGHETMPYTLISPRHAVCSAHAFRGQGAAVRFIAADGTPVEREILTHSGSNLQLGNQDIHIALLESDMPASFGFAKVLPAEIEDFLPSVASGFRVPCAVFDKDQRLHVHELRDFKDTGVFSYYPELPGVALDAPPVGTPRSAFYEDLMPGDSGSPAFLILNGEAVLLMTAYSGGHGAGPGHHAQLDHINDVMAALQLSVTPEPERAALVPYALTPASLSGFNNYG